MFNCSRLAVVALLALSGTAMADVAHSATGPTGTSGPTGAAGAPAVLGAYSSEAAAAERLFVRFEASMTLAEREAALGAAGVKATVFRYEPLVPGLLCVSTDAGLRDGAIAALSAMPGVMYAHRVHEVFALNQSTPYGVPMVNAPAAWTTTRGGGARVAVLDTGIEQNHPDLPTAVLTQSFIAGQTVADVNSHGTHCAGTILALDNTDGVVGVAPSADLMVGKVLSDAGRGDTAGVLAGVNWAVANGAKVISMSLGGGAFEQAFDDGCIAAEAAGVSVVAAAGNDATNNPAYPAWYSNVISVGAIDSTFTRASFSNFGPKLTVCAPGVGVFSTVSGAATFAVEFNSLGRVAFPLGGSGRGVATGPAIFCGFGGTAEDFPASVSGSIAHIRRGNGVTFQVKTANAVAAGAIGVIISNNTTGILTSGTLNATFAIPVVSISQADGNELQAFLPTQDTSITVNYGPPTYGFKSGTSMACPHVAGVAGLLYSRFGSDGLTPAMVRTALRASAVDLGDVGRDDLYGDGLVDANAAILWLTSNLVTSCSLADVASDSLDVTYNPNGSLGPEDLDAFIGAFVSGNAPVADVASDSLDTVRNPNGSVGAEDLDAFIAGFVAGC